MGLDDQKHRRSIEYEIRFGPIDTPEELLAIKGIGEKNAGKESREDNYCD